MARKRERDSRLTEGRGRKGAAGDLCCSASRRLDVLRACVCAVYDLIDLVGYLMRVEVERKEAKM